MPGSVMTSHLAKWGVLLRLDAISHMRATDNWTRPLGQLTLAAMISGRDLERLLADAQCKSLVAASCAI